MMSVNRREPENTISIVSDASGLWGCGAICGCNWFQLEWLGLGQAQQFNIMTKKLLPVVVAAVLWGQSRWGQSVKVLCDNSAVVAMVNSGSSRDPEAMHLRKCLAFVETKWNFHCSASRFRVGIIQQRMPCPRTD